MPSQLKSDTARANGAKSRGPKTPETRAKSSRNSLQHGLTACNSILLDCESPEEFQKLLDQYIAFHQPANFAEQQLLNQMVAALWRIQRISTAEVALVDVEIA